MHCGGVRLGRPDGNLVFGGAGFQLFELQFHLVEQLAAALGRLTKPLALHLGDQQLEISHHRLGAGGTGLRLLPCHALGSQCRLQRGNIIGQRFGRRHNPIIPYCPGPASSQPQAESMRRSPQPAAAGRQVRTGFLQSIPSSI